MKDIILYHGSKSGIKGDIQPISREHCDFGQGFYLGESPDQAKSIVSEYKDPYFYKIRLKLSEIPEDKILFLTNKDWLYAVLACRGKVEGFNQLAVAKEWINRVNSADVVIGKIADDRMNEAMSRFSNLGLTDKGLQACLQSVQYGNQYVLKTPFACSKAEILDEQKLTSKDIVLVQQYKLAKRDEIRSSLYKAIVKYRREGLYLDEIISMEREKNKNNPDLFK